MTPTGNTSVTVGLSRALPAAVAERAVQRARACARSQRVIVPMTDGENTQNRWNSSATSIDARTQKTCDEDLRQRQGHQHQAPHRAGDHRRCRAAQGLRDQAIDVLRCATCRRQPDQQRVCSSIAQSLANLASTIDALRTVRLSVRGASWLPGN
jgi:hypothetical protein